MSLVVASQLDADFNRKLATLPLPLHLIPVPDAEPWRAAADADVLIVRPSPEWIGTRQRAAVRPEAWPGRLRWVFSASAGIDFYPVVLGLANWGNRHLGDGRGAPLIHRHKTCDHDFVPVTTCSHCGDVVEARDVSVRPGPGFADPRAPQPKSAPASPS